MGFVYLCFVSVLVMQSTDLFWASLNNNNRKSRSSVSDDHGHNNTFLLIALNVTHGRCFMFSACLSMWGTNTASYILKGLFCPLCSSLSRALPRCWSRVKTTRCNHTLSLLLTPSLTPSLTQSSAFFLCLHFLMFPPFPHTLYLTLPPIIYSPLLTYTAIYSI